MKRKILLLLLIITSVAGVFIYKELDWFKKMRLLSEQFQKHPPGEIKIKTLNLKDGDIIFHHSRSAQSEAIALATHSEYTHCGIVFKEDNHYIVYEAVEPVKSTPLEEWIGRGKGGTFVAKRLKNADQILNATTLERLKNSCNKWKGKHYDSYFDWSNDRIYCSELVWKVYREATGLEIGKLQRLKDFDLSSESVKQKMKERYGIKTPLNMKVISPAAIFFSDMLTVVD